MLKKFFLNFLLQHLDLLLDGDVHVAAARPVGKIMVDFVTYPRACSDYSDSAATSD